ncbi:hypothetical protein AB07_2361 [Citrobacter freundii]|nr:hypothetical protein AB07_2361 [Citrobacter freundii]
MHKVCFDCKDLFSLYTLLSFSIPFYKKTECNDFRKNKPTSHVGFFMWISAQNETTNIKPHY